jgi:hypothetical protein
MVASALASLWLLYRNEAMLPFAYLEFCSAPSMPPELYESWIDVKASANQFDDVLDAIDGVAAMVASAAAGLFDARWLVETVLDNQLYDALELVDGLTAETDMTA